MRRLLCGLPLVFAQTLWAADDHHAHPAPATPPAPGYAALPYASPEPGSYALPVLRQAADGAVREDGGRATSLHALFDGRLVVLSFIFTHCADPNGCPLASFVMRQIGRKAAATPELAGKVRLVSLSFDPARDTPARLAEYAASFRKPGMDWHFVTTDDEQTLLPLLAAYGQSIQRDPDGSAFSHQLRVFLIDPQRNIRNEYSTAFLHADTVLADLLTVLRSTHPAPATVENPPPAQLAQAGDDKQDYERATYRTRSRSLATRRGDKHDLIAQLKALPTGLPPLPADAVPTAAALDLGRRLFFDRRLSHNNTLSCASCHVPDQGFTHHELATPVGFEGRTVKRNAPSLYNVVYQQRLFHDAREFTLEQQAWSPLLAVNEMANPSIGYVLHKLGQLDDYAAAFDAAFHGRGLTQETLGAALAAYERALVSGNSPFDRWRYGADGNALTAEQRRGFELFTGKAGCSSCHLVGDRHALFTDQALHNTGIGYARSMHETVPSQVLVGPGTLLTVAPAAVSASSERPPNDLGRYEVTLRPADRWRYKTPSLRNVSVTAPYMHDGSLRTLAEVVAFYDAGGVPNEGLDPRIKPLGLDAPERNAIVAFLHGLRADNIEILTRDAFAQGIGDIADDRSRRYGHGRRGTPGNEERKP